MSIKPVFLVFIFVLTVSAVKKSYEGYKLYKVVPKSEDEVKILTEIRHNGVGEFWEDQFGIYHDIKVMVSKDNQSTFLKRMKYGGITAIEVTADLQKLIDNHSQPIQRTGENTESLLSMTWNRYHNLTEIYNWLDELESTYPDVVSTVTMGQSTENRDLKGIIINYRPDSDHKMIGVLEGTLHAREWISPATVTWIVKEFLTSNDPNVRHLAESFEWHIFPVVNPDGYEYTFTNNRMWRKNRNRVYATTCATDDDMSNGVDLNRNFDYMWMTVGASADPCSNTFAGPTALSEIETRAITQYMLNLQEEGQIIYYLAFHSYSQLVVIPYSHVASGSDALLANNYADTYEIAIRSAERLERRFGTRYRSGVSAEVMYPMSGTSFDWVKNEINVPVCYLLELRDLGNFGFLLPPEQIIPNNLEIMDFLLEMDRTTQSLRYYSSTTSIIYSARVIVFSVLFVLHFN